MSDAWGVHACQGAADHRPSAAHPGVEPSGRGEWVLRKSVFRALAMPAGGWACQAGVRQVPAPLFGPGAIFPEFQDAVAQPAAPQADRPMEVSKWDAPVRGPRSAVRSPADASDRWARLALGPSEYAAGAAVDVADAALQANRLDGADRRRFGLPAGLVHLQWQRAPWKAASVAAGRRGFAPAWAFAPSGLASPATLSPA